MATNGKESEDYENQPKTVGDYLVDACSEGNLEKVKMYINEGAHPSYDDSSPSYTACLFGHVDILEYLFNLGVGLNDRLLLLVASRQGHLGVVKLLIARGSNVSKFGGQAVLEASANGHFDVLKCLHKNGANIHLGGDFALINACTNNYPKIVSYLIDNGADINADGGEPIRYALERHSYICLQLLVNNGADTSIFSRPESLRKVVYGLEGIVDTLINMGVDPKNDKLISLCCKHCSKALERSKKPPKGKIQKEK